MGRDAAPVNRPSLPLRAGTAAENQIAYFQVGDVPGRKEPLTGEINYRNVFKAIHAKGYKGFLGMEHGLSGGRGVTSPKKIHNCFKAYEWCDSWD